MRAGQVRIEMPDQMMDVFERTGALPQPTSGAEYMVVELHEKLSDALRAHHALEKELEKKTREHDLATRRMAQAVGVLTGRIVLE